MTIIVNTAALQVVTIDIIWIDVALTTDKVDQIVTQDISLLDDLCHEKIDPVIIHIVRQAGTEVPLIDIPLDQWTEIDRKIVLVAQIAKMIIDRSFWLF